jgi:integrase
MPRRNHQLPQLTKKKIRAGQFKAVLRLCGKIIYCGDWSDPDSQRRANGVIQLWLDWDRPRRFTSRQWETITRAARDGVDQCFERAPSAPAAAPGAGLGALARNPEMVAQLAAIQGMTPELLASLLTAGAPQGAPASAPVDCLSLRTLAAKFLEDARQKFAPVEGQLDTGTYSRHRRALDLICEMYGELPADRIRAAQVHEFRLELIRRVKQSGKQISTAYVNKMVQSIKVCYKTLQLWEDVPHEVAAVVRDVPPLKPTEYGTVVHDRIEDVSIETVLRTLPYLPRVLADMVKIQMLTGMRPNELHRLRPRDLRRDGDGMFYEPTHHKTVKHGKRKVIALPAEAIRILQPYLSDRRPEDYCFSPADSEARRRAEGKILRQAGRKLTAKEKARIYKIRGQDVTSKSYNKDTYRRAIARAIEAANAAGDRIEHWHPYQIRHQYGTLASQAGADALAIADALGHADTRTTARYIHNERKNALRVANAVAETHNGKGRQALS